MSGISDEDSEKMGGKMKREMFQNSREAGWVNETWPHSRLIGNRRNREPTFMNDQYRPISGKTIIFPYPTSNASAKRSPLVIYSVTTIKITSKSGS
jgi:hypothetical protein